jgi:protein involved in polysaccharide export with SLBB domain
MAICRTFGLSLVIAGLAVGTVAAQDPQPVDVRRPQATRTELEAGLANLQQVIASPAYSKSLRRAKEIEADLVRQRLAEGDFQVGDQIDVVVVNEPTLTSKFTVLADRTLSLPQLPPITVRGVLRSEIRDYLTNQIGKYVKNPQVTIQGSYIRLAIMGGVGKPGYYSLPADNLVSDAIMTAGGPVGDVRIEKSKVRRNGQDVIPEGELQKAIEQGLSLDQLNLHGGDELVVDAKRANNNNNRNGWGIRNFIWPIQAVAGLTFLLIRIL